MSGKSYAVVGNSTFSCMMDEWATVVWGCFPRHDGDPVFNSLLNMNSRYSGFFAFDVDDAVSSTQYYDGEESVTLKTRVASKDGSIVEITDLCPKF